MGQLLSVCLASGADLFTGQFQQLAKEFEEVDIM